MNKINFNKQILWISLALGAFMYMFFYTFFIGIKGGDFFTKHNLFVFPGSFYYSFGLVIGWLALDFPSKKLWKAPIIGHLIYFFLKLFISVYFGFFYLPVFLIISLKRSLSKS